MMNRRAYLTALGAATAAVSGCSEGNSTDTTPSATDRVPTPTEQGTVTADQSSADPTPRVTDAGLLLDSGSFTSIEDEIDSVGQGGTLVVGAEYDLPVSDGSAQGLVEVRVHDSDGAKVTTGSEEIDAVVTGDSAYHSDRFWFAFDTADWELGSYTAEVLLNDRGHGTSTSTEVPVDIVEPLGAGEVEMRIAEFPDDAVGGEAFTWTLGFRNRTDRDSSIVADTVTFDPARREAVTISSETRENIPANEEILVESEIGVPYADSYSYRIDAIDAEVGFTIQPPEE